MKTALQALLFLLGILACCAVSYLIGVRRGYERGYGVSSQVDTVQSAKTDSLTIKSRETCYTLSTTPISRR